MKFWKNESGNFAVPAALLAMPLLAASGMVVDMNAINSAKRTNQDALDAAVLAAAREPNMTAAKKLMSKAYDINNGSGNLVDIVYTDTSTERSISATSRFVKKNYFGGILGQGETEIRVKAKAVAKPALFEVRIKPEYGRGTFRKIMRLFDVPNNSAPVEVANINYYIPGATGPKTLTMTPNTNQYLTITNPSSIYFTMDIDPTSAYVTANTRLHFATNDPATSFHLFVDGRQLPVGVAVNIADYVPCGSTALFEWEDGGGFASQDFGFKVTGKCEVSAASPVALVE